MPRGFNDDEIALVRDHLVLPQVVAFRPDARMLQCCVDTLCALGQPCVGFWAGAAALGARRPWLNPLTVGRLWTGIWRDMVDKAIPDPLSPKAEPVLRELGFPGNLRRQEQPEARLTSLKDAPRHGVISDDVRRRAKHLAKRAAVRV